MARCEICTSEREEKVCVDCKSSICAVCEEKVLEVFEDQLYIAPEEVVCVDCMCLRMVSHVGKPASHL